MQNLRIQAKKDPKNFFAFGGLSSDTYTSLLRPPNFRSWIRPWVIIYSKCLPQICTKMNNFKFDFSKNFLGRGSPSPLPRPLPRFVSGFALGSGSALNSQALRSFDSGFALDSRALRALYSGFALNFGLENLVWPPQKY